MTERRRDEYDKYAPMLAEYAGMPVEDLRRAGLHEQLVVAFLPVARHVARRFSGRGEATDDLEQVATLGLLNALSRFDPARGRDFLSYAIPTIMGEVRRYFRDSSWTVGTPRSIKDRYVAVGAAISRLSMEYGRAPTVSELAMHLGLSRDQVSEAIAAHGSYRPASLDQTLLGGDDDSALVNILGVTDTDLEHVEVRALVADLVSSLPERERIILGLRFIHEKTQSEIGASLCISQMHVSRLLTRSLAQLREQIDLQVGSSTDAVVRPPALAAG